MKKKIKLKLNKQIVSKLNNIKGGTDVTRTCPIIIYSKEPMPTRGNEGVSCDCHTNPIYCSQAPGCNTLYDYCTSMVNCQTYPC